MLELSMAGPGDGEIWKLKFPTPIISAFSLPVIKISAGFIPGSVYSTVQHYTIGGYRPALHYWWL